MKTKQYSILIFTVFFTRLLIGQILNSPQGNLPTGQSSITQKCNELTDPGCDTPPPNQGGAVYRDADGDGYGTKANIKYWFPPSPFPFGYVTNYSDCNDNNRNINPNTRWYRDSDGDGYGNPNNYKIQCMKPSGYVINNGDCNDSNKTITLKTRWYRDADGDGYGDSNNSKLECGQPLGYVINNGDCNDGDALYNPNTTWCKTISQWEIPIVQCTQPGANYFMSEYGGCTKFVVDPIALYFDYDKDGYGDPNKKKYFLGNEPDMRQYVGNNQDCNDQDSSLNPNTTWYQDQDSDGKGDPNKTKKQCTQPTGYVRNNHDECPEKASENSNGCPIEVDKDHISCPNCKGNTNVNLSNQNYIYVQEPLEGVSSVTSSTKKVHSIQYFDGLGRPMQSIGINASPNGKDIVTPIVYDEFGRQVKDYLPYASSQNTGSYIETTTAVNDVTSYYSTHYGDTTPYSEKVLESSPLNRVLQQAAPGEVWKKESGHQIEFNYEANAANEVKRFDATTGADFIPSLADKDYYAAGELYKTITRDENHESNSGNKHTIEEFKDKEGRVVLKRTYDNTGVRLDTYYVYDSYGNLSYVLPPKMKGSKENLAQLGYQYRYDARNRLVEKQLPGKAREYLVYDKQDRLVATQDGKLRAEGSGHWLFTKYDQFGRVLYTGISSGGTNRSTVQSAVNAKGSNNETHGGFSQDGITVPYTNSTAYPNGILELLTVNIYDHYPNGSPSAPSSIEGQSLITASTTPNLKGLNTVTYTRVIPNGTIREDWQKVYTYYDLKSRPVRTYNQNHLGGYTISDSKLDFRGKPEYTKTIHKGTINATEQTTLTYFTYDHAERLVKTEQQDTGSSTKITLSENTYDELGQLTSKKVGNNLQTVDYNYNIRGWLTDINNVAGLGNDLFAFKLYYDNPQTSIGNVTGLYNGNISQTRWKTANDNKLRSYGYEYDALNRINTALFEDGSTTPNSYNVRNITYDENGNIKTLNRWMQAGTLMDELSYTYDTGNRLLKVSDGSNSTHGFKDGNKEGNDYEYDMNGNMIVDKNKGITNIKYNYLNLPREIVFGNGTKIEYLYDASGIKLQKKIFEGSKTTVTDYLDGYQYVDGVLEFYPHAEGYVKINEDNTINYVYNYLDHLGNVRVSYVNDNGIAKIVEESNYYPFGLKHKGYNNQSNQLTDKYKYGYQGQELQDELGLNWSSFKWRNADPALGRFMSIDPLAEEYMYNSTYAFQENKLGMGRELEGLELEKHDWLTGVSNKINEYKTEKAKKLVSRYKSNDTKIMAYSFAMEALLETTDQGEWLTTARESMVETYGSEKSKEVSEVYSEVISVVSDVKEGIQELMDNKGKDIKLDTEIMKVAVGLGLEATKLQIENMVIDTAVKNLDENVYRQINPSYNQEEGGSFGGGGASGSYEKVEEEKDKK